MEPMIYTWSVRSANLDLQLVSEMGVGRHSCGTEPLTSRKLFASVNLQAILTLSEFSKIVGQPAGVEELLGVWKNHIHIGI